MDNNLTESSKDLMRLIQLKFSRLSKGQKLIAEYILKNYDKAAFMTAARLGNICRSIRINCSKICK